MQSHISFFNFIHKASTIYEQCMSIWQIKSDQMYCRNKIFFPYLNRNIDNININHSP